MSSLIQALFSGRFNKAAGLKTVRKRLLLCSMRLNFCWRFFRMTVIFFSIIILWFLLGPLGSGKHSVWKTGAGSTLRKISKPDHNLKTSKERIICFLACIWCYLPVSVYSVWTYCINQETVDIHLQNNGFTLKIYKNVNSFVHETSDDLSPMRASLVEELLMKAFMLFQVLLRYTWRCWE